jgi:hypothetical protein
MGNHSEYGWIYPLWLESCTHVKTALHMQFMFVSHLNKPVLKTDF